MNDNTKVIDQIDEYVNNLELNTNFTNALEEEYNQVYKEVTKELVHKITEEYDNSDDKENFFKSWYLKTSDLRESIEERKKMVINDDLTHHNRAILNARVDFYSMLERISF